VGDLLMREAVCGAWPRYGYRLCVFDALAGLLEQLNAIDAERTQRDVCLNGVGRRPLNDDSARSLGATRRGERRITKNQSSAFKRSRFGDRGLAVDAPRRSRVGQEGPSARGMEILDFCSA
jgi:hypothetical protein